MRKEFDIPPPEPYVAKASRGEPKDESTVARLAREARTVQHAFGHRYHNPFCKHCVRANAQRKRIKKGTLAMGPKPEKFGMQVTGDYLISAKRKNQEEETKYAEPGGVGVGGSSSGSESPAEAGGDDPWWMNNDVYSKAKNGLVLHDRATNITRLYPTARRNHDETVMSMKHYQGPTEERKVKSFDSDGGGELKSAAKELKWLNPRSQPYVHETNGLIERIARMVRKGTRANISQSGLGPVWWPCAGTHYCSARSIEVNDGTSDYFSLHGEHCKALQIPFGALSFCQTLTGHVGSITFVRACLSDMMNILVWSGRVATL